MGYACPVCDEQQADAVHLANHLAITASLGRQDHLEWLEEYAPDWADCGPEELGERVVEYALEVETPEFEGSAQGHSHGKPSFENELARQTSQPGRGGAATSGDTGRVLEEAREMTAQMYEDGDEDGDGDGDEDGDEDEEGSDDESGSNSGAGGGEGEGTDDIETTTEEENG